MMGLCYVRVAKQQLLMQIKRNCISCEEMAGIVRNLLCIMQAG